MFKWWKKRKDIKRIKALKQSFLQTMHDLILVKTQTSIGNNEVCPDVYEARNTISVLVGMIDEEIEDRTKERPHLFRENKKSKTPSL